MIVLAEQICASTHILDHRGLGIAPLPLVLIDGGNSQEGEYMQAARQCRHLHSPANVVSLQTVTSYTACYSTNFAAEHLNSLSANDDPAGGGMRTFCGLHLEL